MGKGHTRDNMEIKNANGRTSFITRNDKGEENISTYFGTIKGTSKWCKVVEPDQYDNYAVDVYPSEEDMKALVSDAEEILDEVKALVIGTGKKVNGVADLVRTDNDGVDYFQFKRKGTKSDGTPNTPPKVYNENNALVEGWSKLIGNGSKIGVAYQLTPYYMASTKMVGLSMRFYAIKIDELVEYRAGGNSNPFGEPDVDETPIDEDSIPF